MTRTHRSGRNATWLLLHINTSDYKDGDTNAPEYFGAEIACINRDVVRASFQSGEVTFQLNFSAAELNDSALLEKPSAQQNATLKLSVPSCAKPSFVDVGVEQVFIGQPEEAGRSFDVCRSVESEGKDMKEVCSGTKNERKRDI